MVPQSLKRVYIFLIISTFALVAKAQQVHFIYLQTENGQPFYVKMNNNVLSSSVAGYLIIPKLIDGDYKVFVGFPKNEYPEENFNITVDKKNQGYLLKNFGDKGWGLFNLQSFAVEMSGDTNKTESVTKNLQNDPFSKMLASVVKDSTILQKNDVQVAVIPLQKDSVKIDSLKIDSSNIVVQDSSSKIKQATPLLSTIPVRVISKTNEDGTELVYVDPSKTGNDTVRIYLPIEKVVNASNNDTANKQPIVINDNSSVSDSLLSSPPKDSSKIAGTNPAPKVKSDTSSSASPVFIEDISSIKTDSLSQKKELNRKEDIANANPKKVEDKVEDSAVLKAPEATKTGSVRENITLQDSSRNEMVVLPKSVSTSSSNSDCKAFANDEDFLKLRKKMAAENSDEDMIKVAKKVFHTKCFSTEQIKNLSYLFLTDEGKYRFFDEAYAFASDSEKYATLQSQFTDNYYLNRFKAMIRK